MAQNVRIGFSWLGIVLRFPENPQLLSASKIDVHQTSISFSGPSKNSTLSIVPDISLAQICFKLLCFKLTIIPYNTQKQKQIKFEPGIKLNPIRCMRQMKWLY